jgi:uncharacterized protein YdcH (DUF465 family)
MSFTRAELDERIERFWLAAFAGLPDGEDDAERFAYSAKGVWKANNLVGERFKALSEYFALLDDDALLFEVHDSFAYESHHTSLATRAAHFKGLIERQNHIDKMVKDKVEPTSPAAMEAARDWIDYDAAARHCAGKDIIARHRLQRQRVLEGRIRHFQALEALLLDGEDINNQRNPAAEEWLLAAMTAVEPEYAG